MTTAQPHRPPARLAALICLVASLGLASGCCQPGCIPAQPACPPMATQPATVRYGEVCQTPAPGSSAVAASGSSGAATMGSAPRPRVVVSEPSNRLARRGGWRRSDPESVITRVDGAVDDESVQR